MANAKERLRVLENVMARVGLGGDVLSEYSKALSTMSGLDSMAELNTPPLPPTAMGTEAQTPPSDTQIPPGQIPPTVV